MMDKKYDIRKEKKDNILTRATESIQTGFQSLLASLDEKESKKKLKNGISISLTFLVIWILLAPIGLYRSIYWVDYRYFYITVLGNFALILLAIGTLVLSTLFDEYNIYRMKRRIIAIVYFSLVVSLMQLFNRIMYYIVATTIVQLKVTPIMTIDMILWACRSVMIYTQAIILIAAINVYIKYKQNKRLEDMLLTFKLSHHIDTRMDIEYQYDLRNIVWDKETGEMIPVKEKDRWLHINVDGTSGTGKTSMVLINQIKEDMYTKVRNENEQMRLMFNMLFEDKAYRIHDREYFNVNDFAPKTEHKEEFEQNFVKKYRSAGITVMAPMADLIDKTCNLAETLGLHYNRVDPHRTDNGGLLKGAVGLNPLYINPNKKYKNQFELPTIIDKKAGIFRDVLKALNEIESKNDPYFQGVNDTLAYKLAVLKMVLCPIRYGRCATPDDIKEALGDLDSTKEDIALWDMEVNKAENGGISKIPAVVAENFKDVPQYFRNKIINDEKSGQKLKTEANGMQNLMDKVLNNPLIHTVLCCDDDKCLDLDKAIADGEIIAVNYSLDLGDTYSTAFGLFFLLNYNAAIKRRPGNENTRLPNFFTIDELPVLIHPSIEGNFTLFRQFRCSMTVALQTLSQMNKNDMTKYLKQIIAQAGTHIVFGRVNIDEMDLYERLIGTKEKAVEQISYMENSITADNAQMSLQTRTAYEEVAIISGNDMRNRDFKEVTFILVRDGRLYPPIHGVCDFMEDIEWEPIERPDYDFSTFEVIEVDFSTLSRKDIVEATIYDDTYNVKTKKEEDKSEEDKTVKSKKEESKENEEPNPYPTRKKREGRYAETAESAKRVQDTKPATAPSEGEITLEDLFED